jgi:hypothetical protein
LSRILQLGGVCGALAVAGLAACGGGADPHSSRVTARHTDGVIPASACLAAWNEPAYSAQQHEVASAGRFPEAEIRVADRSAARQHDAGTRCRFLFLSGDRSLSFSATWDGRRLAFGEAVEGSAEAGPRGSASEPVMATTTADGRLVEMPSTSFQTQGAASGG